MKPADRAAYEAELGRVAKQLGIALHGDLEGAVIEHCETLLSQWIYAHGQPLTLTDLLVLVAACLDLQIEEIQDDEGLQELLKRIPPGREPSMARLLTELDDETDGILIQRMHRQPWERAFLAVINCRGRHAFRRYFSAWHEVAHLLVEGRELRFAFRQSSVPVRRRDPEEVLADRVAAALGFYSGIFEPAFREKLRSVGRLTFDVVDDVRQKLAPEASRQATLLACVRYCPDPVHFVRCGMGYKKAEERSLASPQMSLLPDQSSSPQQKLRVTEIASSPTALGRGIRVHQKMQVPESSVVTLAFRDSWSVTQTGKDLLHEWQTSSGGPIGQGEIEVEAVRVDNEVWALLHLGPTSGPAERERAAPGRGTAGRTPTWASDPISSPRLPSIDDGGAIRGSGLGRSGKAGMDP